MQLEEFQALVADQLVRIVMQDGTFHLVTLSDRMCTPAHRGSAAIGSEVVWSSDTGEWISIYPREIFAHQVIKID